MRRLLRRETYAGLFDRLAFRLLLLLTVALLPLGAIAVLTTAETIRSSVWRSERALIGLTNEAVAGQRSLIESALAAAQALGPLVLERRGNPGECSAMLADYVARSGVFSFAAFIAAEGQVDCRSAGEDAVDYSGSPRFQALQSAPRSVVSFADESLATGNPVVVSTAPVSVEGQLQGFVSVSVSARSLELIGSWRMRRDAPVHSVLLNAQGLALEISRESRTPDMLPADTALDRLIAGGNRVFHGRTVGGDPAVFAVAEVIPGLLYALGVWETDSLPVSGTGQITIPLLFPVLMWLASLGVAFISIYYLVLRHIRQLNSQVRRFALGQRGGWRDLGGGMPLELRELDGTFRKMARIIARDEAAREAALAEKTVLLKEIHHRVKNNLQLVASMINLQMRQVHDRQGRRVLEAIQERVLGLATIHRALYEEDRLSRVRADRVLDEILQRITLSWGNPAHGLDVRRRLDPLELSGERMVPLSLLLTEAATNAMKHVGRPADAGRPWLEITLTAGADRQIELRIANSLGTALNAERIGEGDSVQLGMELIEAFAEQLDGALETGPIEDPRGPAWALAVRFEGDPAI